MFDFTYDENIYFSFAHKYSDEMMLRSKFSYQSVGYIMIIIDSETTKTSNSHWKMV